MSNTAPTSTAAPSRGSAHDAFRTVLSEAVTELLQHYGMHVVAVEAVAAPIEIRGHQVAGIIGFAGSEVSGTVAVRAGSPLVRDCLPIAAAAGEEALALGDWIAELANQLLGRTKNKLLRFGTAFHITPPTFAAADELIVVGHDRERTWWLCVTTNAGLLGVMLELHTASNFQLLLVEQDSAVAQAEGEIVLF